MSATQLDRDVGSWDDPETADTGAVRGRVVEVLADGSLPAPRVFGGHDGGARNSKLVSTVGSDTR